MFLPRPLLPLIAFATALVSAFGPWWGDAAAEPVASQYFPETGHSVTGRFAEAYVRLGGLDRFGYPRTEALTEDGRTVQYFQRAVMEYWPEHAGTRYEVQLRLLGYAAGQNETHRAAFAGVARATVGARYFPETRHSVGPPFLAVFEAGGDNGVGRHAGASAGREAAVRNRGMPVDRQAGRKADVDAL